MNISHILNTIYKNINLEENSKQLIGFLSKDKNILAIGNDTKILGRLFEIAAKPFLKKAAKELHYNFYESNNQTSYPDFWFEINNGKRIAIDIKSTYRKFYKKSNIVKPFKFTLGSYSSFLRGNGTKNINGNYSDYIAHIVIGFIYTRNNNATVKTLPITRINEINPPYKNIKFFVQEKYKIGGQSKGSGNTANIATIKSNNINDFKEGNSYFSYLGANEFENYWKHYPLYKEKNPNYTNLREYILWIKSKNETKGNKLISLYNKWKQNNDSNIK